MSRVFPRRSSVFLASPTSQPPTGNFGFHKQARPIFNRAPHLLLSRPMLASNTQLTPRPRPPAKMRRSSSQTRDWRSPPPYAPFAANVLPPMPTLLGSPIAATSQLIQLTDLHEDEVQEKSKEELEELLRRASNAIKERERELDLTSETCKTLAENNAVLKKRNDTLIARLPSSQPSSPLLSPSFYSRPLISPSHSRTPSISSPLLSPNPGSVRRRPGHARRVSTTPAELAVLADQNAELLAKLADLEAEASRAEQTGKRRLRNLEAEIDCLQRELERARAESERLEETIQKAPQVPPGLNDQVVKLYKRLSREAKVRELKAKTRPWEQSEKAEQPKNFAPDNLTPGLPFTSNFITRNKSTPSLSIHTSLDKIPTAKDDDAISKVMPIESPSTASIPPSATSTIGTTSREQALVSQLLLKIRELEETNTQLAANHLKASLRLKEAQTESESVRRLCEFISDEVDGDIDVELEVVNNEVEEEEDVSGEAHDNEPSELQTSPKISVRLRSVGRKSSMDFGSGSARHSVRLRKFRSMDSFPSSEDLASVDAGPRLADRHPKARKTVLGLFDESTLLDAPTLTSTPPTSLVHDISSSDHLSEPRLVFPHDFSSSDGTQVDSDAEGSHVQSLGSELGLQLDGLHPAPGLGHVRSKSIMELLNSTETTSSLPSVPSSPSTLQPPVPIFPSPRNGSRLQRRRESREQLTLDERVKYPSLRRAKSSAVFGATTSTAAVTTPTFSLRREIQNGGGQQQTFGLASVPPSPATPVAQAQDRDSQSEQKEPEEQQQNPLGKLHRLVFELWLWMYFAAVIVVFVFTLARKGPKVVLNNNNKSSQSGKN